MRENSATERRDIVLGVRGRQRKRIVLVRRISVTGVLPGRVSERGTDLCSAKETAIPRARQMVATRLPGDCQLLSYHTVVVSFFPNKEVEKTKAPTEGK